MILIFYTFAVGMCIFYFTFISNFDVFFKLGCWLAGLSVVAGRSDLATNLPIRLRAVQGEGEHRQEPSAGSGIAQRKRRVHITPLA